MRAIRFERYGGPEVLRLQEMPEPSPRPGEAKVRVHAVALNPLDWKVRAGHLRFVPLFRGPPRGLGCDFAGEIVRVGGGATDRHVGERVFGSLRASAREGALADFLVTSYERLLPLTDGVDATIASALPIAGGTALQALTDDCHLMPGQRVLITGAAGGVGHFAVQIAKHLGAHVVGVCGAANADFVRGLGADEVIDYAHEDFTRRDDRFDVVFDAASASNFEAAARVLTDTGCYLNTSGSASAVARTLTGAVWARLTSRRRAVPIALRNGPKIWQRVMDLVQQGVVCPHIERIVALDEMSDALRAMETGHGRGKIVVRIAS